MDLEAFLAAYIETALWSSHEYAEDGSDMGNLDESYGPDDIDPETIATMRQECADFISYAAKDLAESGLSDERAGHNFWLNRNGHGAGFWDEGLGEVGESLSKASKSFGSADLYVADGKVHQS